MQNTGGIEAEAIANKPDVEKEASRRFEQKLKESYDRVWRERDDFIRWIALFAVSAMYFSITLIVDHKKAEHPYFSSSMLGLLEISIVFFFVSLVSTVFYKWRWSVKYLFDELELEDLQKRWEKENVHLKQPDDADDLDYFLTPEYQSMKKRIKRHVRTTETLYKSALTFFVAAFIPLFLALSLFVHPKLAPFFHL